MYEIKFENRNLWSALIDRLLDFGIKGQMKYAQCPPKEYKSSPYRFWYNYIMVERPVTKTKVSGYAIYFRDEQDFIFATLLNDNSAI